MAGRGTWADGPVRLCESLSTSVRRLESVCAGCAGLARLVARRGNCRPIDRGRESRYYSVRVGGEVDPMVRRPGAWKSKNFQFPSPQGTNSDRAAIATALFIFL